MLEQLCGNCVWHYSIETFGECAMPTSEHYKHSADECRRLAKDAHDDIEREALLKMATQWDRLAEHKAKIEGREGR